MLGDGTEEAVKVGPAADGAEEEFRARARTSSSESGSSVYSKKTERVERFVDTYYEGRFGFSQYPLQFNETVLCSISRRNPIRAACISIVRSTWFEMVILVVILISSLMMAMYNPVAAKLGVPDPINNIADEFEWFFQIVFTIEFLVKVVALGLTSRPSGYFREGWNYLDFVIVIMGWIPLIVFTVRGESGTKSSMSSTFMVFRSVRILRPLRALHFFPKLKQLASALIRSAVSIGEVMVLCFSILLIFAIVGVVLFKGKLRQHCGYYDELSGQWAIPADELESFCSFPDSSFGRQCPTSMTCIVTDFNPNEGLTAFDNLGIAILTVFQIITLEGWSTIMYNLFDTTFTYTGVYFILLILFGNFFMINLVVSALSVNYMIVRREGEEKDQLENQRVTFMDRLVMDAEYKAALVERFLDLPVQEQISQMQMRLMFSYEVNYRNPLYSIVTEEEYDKYMVLNKDTYHKWKRRFQRKMNAVKRRSVGGTLNSSRISTLIGGDKSRFNTSSPQNPRQTMPMHDGVSAIDVKVDQTNENVQHSSRPQPPHSEDGSDVFVDTIGSLHQLYDRTYGDVHSFDFNNTSAQRSTSIELSNINEREKEQNSDRASNSVEDSSSGGETNTTASLENSGQLLRTFSSRTDYQDADSQPDRQSLDRLNSAKTTFSEQPIDSSNNGTGESRFSPGYIDTSPRENEALNAGKGVLVPLGSRSDAPRWRKWVHENITDTKWFKVSVMLLILLNTAVMASEYFGQPEWMFSFLSTSNLVFLAFYTLEIILRLMGDGFYYYFSIWFNWFDVIIVATGYLELLLVNSSVAAMFRLLRILRFLKLAHFWPTFANLLEGIRETVKQVCPFLVFFSLFLFIFTISGVHILGGKLAIDQNMTVEPYTFSSYPSLESNTSIAINGTNEVVVLENPDFDCTGTVGHFLWTLPNGSTAWHCPERANYDSFLWSLVTTFQVITGEDWNGVMYMVVEKTGSYWYVIYFVFLVIFGGYIILNFFLAILIDTFVELHMQREKEKEQKRLERALRRQRTKELRHLSSTFSSDEEDGENSSSTMNTVSIPHIDTHGFGTTRGDLPRPIRIDTRRNTPDDLSPSPVSPVPDNSLTPIAVSPPSTAQSPVSGPLGRPSLKFSPSGSVGSDALRFELPRRKLSKGNSKKSLSDVVEKKNKKTYNLSEEEVKELPAFKHNSLCCIRPTNPFRLQCGVLIYKSWFDLFIFLVILLSCVLLAVDSPDSKINPDVMYAFNFAITLIFALEAGIKIFALGFFRGKGSYLRSYWNVLDLFIVLVSIVDVALPNSNAGFLQVLRALRCLRPLRAVKRFDGLRVVVKSLAKAIVPCAQVLMLCIVFYAVFSICAVNFFAGKTYACYECPIGEPDPICERKYGTNVARDCMVYPDYGVTDESCPISRQCMGIDSERNVSFHWLNPSFGSLTFTDLESHSYSFDSFPSSFLLLFEISSMEMWMEPMYVASDIVGIGFSPVRSSSNISVVFFLIFLFTLHFFMLQVFVAVLIDTYFDSSDEEKGDAFMTSEQRLWVDFNRKALKRPYRPHNSLMSPKQNKLRQICFKIVTTSAFKVFIIAVILANTLLLMTSHFDESPAFSLASDILDILFGSIYILEAVMKIIGFGPRRYFSRRGNCFDFFIVIAVLVGWIVAVSLQGTSEFEAVFSAVEVLRVLRVVRLLKYFPALRPLLSTLLFTFYPLMNILLLILLVLFIYSILGMQLFGNLLLEPEMEFVSDHVNFYSFFNSFFTLFVMSTGESWNGVMRDLNRGSPHAIWFCVSFVVLMQLFLLNLFVAVILASFTAEFENKRRTNGVKVNLDEHSLRNYNKEWNKIHLSYVNSLQSRLRDAQRSKNTDAVAHARHRLQDAVKNPRFLPAQKFPDLMLRLEAPLGFRKRSSKAKFTIAHVMRYVKDKHIPVTKQGLIHYYSTLSALIDINVLQGEVPKDVEAFLKLKVANYNKPSTDESVAESTTMTTILAREQIKNLIRTHAIHWKMRYLKKHGASDESIRRYLEQKR